MRQAGFRDRGRNVSFWVRRDRRAEKDNDHDRDERLQKAKE